MTSYRVLVTGSRTWTDEFDINHALNMAWEDNVYGWPMVLIHGTAAGADTLAAREARRRGWRIEPHPAQWRTHTDACPDWHYQLDVCKMAGHRRNAEMVASRADVCLAFIHNNSPGATAGAKLAETAGIPTLYWRR